MTVQEFINLTLRDMQALAQGETPSTEESADALATLNQIILSHSLEPWIWTAQRLTFTLIPGLAIYTIGPAGSWVTLARPTRILGAMSYSGEFQQGVSVIPMTDLLARIKNGSGITAALPELMGVDEAAPLVNARVWATPNSVASMEIAMLLPMTAGLVLGDSISFPVPGYDLALRCELAVTLAPGWGLEIPTGLAANYQRSSGRLSGQRPSTPTPPAQKQQAAEAPNQ